ncbi:MAG TPA: tetratricopeptide repeat protein [Vicinamibacterales bacterium]
MLRARRLFVLLYAASGAAALVYEVSWTRLLTLQLGHTVAGASTVLAAFMGGLAIGAWVAGRFSLARLQTYAALEAAVALFALLLPLALQQSVPLLGWAYADGSAPVRFAIIRIIASLVLIGIPAAAMGATFPIAVGWWARSAADAGVLYAANTAGAALGAIAAGFLLVPLLGVRGTTWIGVALNLIAAAGALWLSREGLGAPASRGLPERAEKKSKKPLRSQRPPRLDVPSASPRLACAAAALSGFVALTYEVAWTRLLALIIGPTTYAFATMAAAFITGLAIGSAAGTRIASRTKRADQWLAAMLIACAMLAVVAAWFAASRMPLIVAGEVAAPDASLGPIVVAQAFRVGLLLLPMTVALGAAFPLALAVATGGSVDTAGGIVEREAARVYTWNTLGAIAGALAAGFILIPEVGLRGTMHSAAIIGIVGGAAIVASALGASARRFGPVMLAAAIGAGAVLAIVTMPPWDRDLLASGAYKYAPYMQSSVFDAVLRAGQLEYYKEGAAGTVTVRRLAGTRSLAIDGKIDASNGGDMLTQRLLGLLPVFLHKNARDICIIGLGSGVTAGAALAPGTATHADVVEISPEVVAASRFFDRENGDVLARPEVRLIVGDGRSHLRLTPRQYDVIVSEPSNPWMAGVAALFTREFFESARARLRPDGLLCQWAHTYDIRGNDLRSIVKTFASVFPQGTMWLIGEGDLLLIGSKGDTPLSLGRLSSQWRSGTSRAALAEVGIAGNETPFALLSLFAGGPEELRRFGADVPVQRDDRMALEFSAPAGIYGRTTSENSDTIRALASSKPAAIQDAYSRATDASWAARGVMELKAEAYGLAFESFRKAVALNARNADALAGLSQAAAPARKADEELSWLKSLATSDSRNANVRIELSRLLASSGDIQGGIGAATEALQVAPDEPRAAEQLASVYADAGDGDRLAPLAEAMVTRFPTRPDPRYYLATAFFLHGQTPQARDTVRALVAAHPDHARAQNLLGAACATLGERECAESAFRASIRANPRDASTYVNLGTFYLQNRNPAAGDLFAEALAIDPTSATARSGLAQARETAKP